MADGFSTILAQTKNLKTLELYRAEGVEALTPTALVLVGLSGAYGFRKLFVQPRLDRIGAIAFHVRNFTHLQKLEITVEGFFAPPYSIDDSLRWDLPFLRNLAVRIMLKSSSEVLLSFLSRSHLPALRECDFFLCPPVNPSALP